MDHSARETPIVAIGGAAREALRLADVLEVMLVGSREAFSKGDRRQISETRRLDNILDRLNTAIRVYVTALEPDSLSDADHQRVREILTFITNMEHAGDIIEMGLLGIAMKKLSRGVTVRLNCRR
jgi:phosphate:Na+ symporter